MVLPKTELWQQKRIRIKYNEKKKGSAKEHWHYCTIILILHAGKMMFKTLQRGFQEYGSQELPGVQAGLKEAAEPEIKRPTSVGS